jgi:hypothetical protein
LGSGETWGRCHPWSCCRSCGRRCGCSWRWSRCRHRAISAAGVQIDEIIPPAPNDHFAARPHCSVIGSASGRVTDTRSCPTISAGIISCASVRIAATTVSAPDDHLAAAPHCRVIESRSGRADGAGFRPSVAARIISAAGTENSADVGSAPNDHFAARPHCSVIGSGSGRVDSTGRCPTICAGIISSACVEKVADEILSAPDAAAHAVTLAGLSIGTPTSQP